MKNFWREHRKFLTGLLATLFLMVGVFFLQGQTAEFMAELLSVEKPAPFDGTSMPIKELPDWAKLASGEYSLLAAQLPTEKKTTMPNYDPAIFGTTLVASNWNSINDSLKNQLITYATPYMGTYESSSKEYEGSHLAVDIKAPTGTKVYAVANGKVSKVAEASSGFGKHIVVTHPDAPALDGNETLTLYSSYSHLSKILVTQNQIVKRGDLIGESGSTGTSTTPHLHFQIDKDTAPWHPWWPFTSADTAAAGVSFFDGVSAGINQAQAIANTINPMLWVQRYLVTGSDTYTAPTTTTETTTTTSDTVASEVAAATTATVDVASLENTATTTDAKATETSDSATTDTTTAEETVTETPAVVTPTVETLFTDLDSTHQNFTAIKYLKEQGIIAGYSDGSFGPDRTVTRVEALKMLELGLNVDCSYSPVPTFPDTSADAWYADFVGCAVFQKIVAGYPDGTFGPANNVNRAEYLKILLGSAKIKPGNVVSDPYRDVSADAWFAGFARYSKEANIFPLSGNNFAGGQSVTRAEVAETIYRMIVLQKTSAEVYSSNLTI
jgi:hypothetical protein